MLIRMCWSRRYSGSEIIGVSCKNKLMWVNTGGLHGYSSSCGSAQMSKTQLDVTLGISLLKDVWRAVAEGYTLPESPLSLLAQQTESNESLTLDWTADFLMCGLKIVLGECDLSSDYTLFPEICLAVVRITYCRVFTQPLSVRHYPKTAVLHLGYSEGYWYSYFYQIQELQ